jgi:hypothetical protein
LPLFADGLKKIRNNLAQLEAGERPKLVKIGTFTPDQLRTINEARQREGLAPVDAVVLFRGKHLYNSRYLRDGYSIEEILEQIQSAFSEHSEVTCEVSTVLRNAKVRIDAQGMEVNDEAVFECTQQHPFPELWSVIPKGDGKFGPKKPNPSKRGLVSIL